MKRAILEFNANFLDYAFIQESELHLKITSGLPHDAKFCACHYDHVRNKFQIIYESDEFEDIHEGAPLPILEDVVAERVLCPLIKDNFSIPQYEA